jgi:UDP-N-acetylmuramoyl-tripeptide--D-alanyl-D-alanine ligase
VTAAGAAGAVAALVESGRVPPDTPAVAVADTWQALQHLAVAVRRQVRPRTVAITGSVGKTTVKDLIAAAVGTQRRTVAAAGSHNNELGVPLTLLRLTHGDEVLVAEIGARHTGDIAALAPLVAPEVAVVTAVAGVHLEIFGSIDAIARAKRELVEALSPDGVAVLNLDDERVAAMAGHAPAVLTYAVDVPADCTAVDVQLDRLARPRFTAHTPWGAVDVAVPIAGRHQVGNALAALASAGYLGIDLTAAAAGIADAVVSRWRAEVVEVDGRTILNDAYNSNPIAVLASLATLGHLAGTRRRVAVLGVMAEIGPTHLQEHVAGGRAAVDAGVDHLVVVGREAAGIAAGARAAGMTGPDVAEVATVDEAVHHLATVLRDGDVVLVKASRVAGLERVSEALAGSGSSEKAAS